MDSKMEPLSQCFVCNKSGVRPGSISFRLFNRRGNIKKNKLGMLCAPCYNEVRHIIYNSKNEYLDWDGEFFRTVMRYKKTWTKTRMDIIAAFEKEMKEVEA